MAEVLVQVYFKILVIAIVNLHDSLCEEWGSHAHQAALWRCGGPDIHLRSRWVPRKPPSSLGDLPRVTSSHRININSQKRGCWAARQFSFPLWSLHTVSTAATTISTP